MRVNDHTSRRAVPAFCAALLGWIIIGGGLTSRAQPLDPPVASPRAQSQQTDVGYVIGSGDMVSVHVANFEDISDKPVAIDLSGNLHLATVGSVPAAGFTASQLETDLAKRLKKYLLKPDVTVVVTEFKSQPVSVIGAVKNPGVQQVQGRKNLVEVLSMAGGIDAATAGSELKLTRRLEWGSIPLPGSTNDPTSEYSVAEVSLKGLFAGEHPEQNIAVKPDDVISVPRADTIYVIGNVQKSGGFLLNEHADVTVLQALSMAGGLDHTAKPQNARILRRQPGVTARTEIPVDLKKVLEGKISDVHMSAEDILFVPNNVPKNAAMRALDTAVQMGTGVVIWGRY